MGYTHYWYWDTSAPKEKIAAVASALQILRPRIEREMGAQIAGPDGTGDPEISDGQICLNGPEDGMCEALVLSPDVGWPQEDGKRFKFCKTRRRPYDLAVTACLLLAKRQYGRCIDVRSDGESKDWALAERIVREELGYDGRVSVDRGGIVLYGPAKKPLEVAA